MELCTNTGHMAWIHSEEYPKCAFFFGSVTPPLLNYVSILYKVDVDARGEEKINGLACAGTLATNTL